MPQTGDSLTGRKKVAIALLGMSTESAGKVLHQMEPKEVEEIMGEFLVLPAILPAETEEIESKIEDYLSAGSTIVAGGDMDTVSRYLIATYGEDEARPIIERFKNRASEAPFYFLQETPAAVLTNALADEQPQVVALVLSYVTPKQVNEVLSGLVNEPERLEEISYKLATLSSDTRDRQLVAAVEERMRQRIQNVNQSRDREFNGKDFIVRTLTSMNNKPLDDSVIAGIRKHNEVLGDEIAARMFQFADLALLPPDSLRLIISKAMLESVIDPTELAIALRADVNEALSDRILSFVSDDNRMEIEEEISTGLKRPMSRIREAQSKVVKVAKRLEEAGEISLQRGGAETNDPLL